jgi:hypothetical protein
MIDPYFGLQQKGRSPPARNRYSAHATAVRAHYKQKYKIVRDGRTSRRTIGYLRRLAERKITPPKAFRDVHSESRLQIRYSWAADPTRPRLLDRFPVSPVAAPGSRSGALLTSNCEPVGTATRNAQYSAKVWPKKSGGYRWITTDVQLSI